MASRRRQSDPVMDQPVRFYKFIALTFLFLTLILAATVVFMSSKRASITIITKITPIDVTAQATISGIDEFRSISGVVKKAKAAGEVVGAPKGTKEEIGVATGVVTLHNEGSAAQPLVATTRLLTEEGVLFRLKDRVTVPANGTVEGVEVYADEEGKASEIGASRFTIPGLNAVKQKVVYATSEAVMAGGVRSVGAIDQNDVDTAREQLKAQLIASVEDQFSGQFEGDGSLLTVSNVVTNEEELLGKEVDSYTLTGSADVVAVFYDKEEMKAWAVKQLLKRAIGDTELIRASDKEPQVNIIDFDATNDSATATVFYEGVVSLNPESKQIAKDAFYGKSKDEVRRYLLSLDHVHSVDLEFHPAWMRSVPHIPDHVGVVVKEVE